MKTRIVALFLILAFVFGSIPVEAITCDFGDTGITNYLQYSNYDFWNKNNELGLVTNYSITSIDNKEENFTKLGKKKLPKKYRKSVEILKEGIKSFFIDFYGIDLSSKLEEQDIKIYSSDIDEVGTVMGYVVADYPNTLNLNNLIITDEYDYLFNNTYVHETLHQLGIRNTEDAMLMEGITDAYTDLILGYINEKSYTTDLYFEARTLAYQIIRVDDELPHLFFETENFSLSERISQKLSDVKCTLEKETNPGNKLVDILDLLYTYNMGYIASNTDPYYYAYDAQDIVRAYYQTFEPLEGDIDYIRSHYLVEEYESISFKKDGNGYSMYIE